MHKFVRTLLTAWRKLELPFSDQTIVIAVSGGADSVALTLALHELKERKKLQLRFIVAHFNHHLRGADSKKDADFVAELARKLNFEYIQKIQNPKSKIQNQKGNLEQNARLARYKFLGEVGKKYNAFAVLTAHTQNDQAETLLLNLIRGSGLEGLAGMKVIRDFEKEKSRNHQTKSQIPNRESQFKLVRPLLPFARRDDTEGFCRDRQLAFREDAMNEDLRFSRVRVRKEIIPLLKKLNPRIIETLSRTAELLREEAHELNGPGFMAPENLSQNDLKKLSKPVRLRVLRGWLKSRRGHLRQLELKHLEALERLILSRKSGREIELPNREKVIKKQGKLFFEKTRVEKS